MHVITGKVNKMVINVNMFEKVSEVHSLMLLNASVGLSAAFNRKSFLYTISVQALILPRISLNHFRKIFAKLEYF